MFACKRCLAVGLSILLLISTLGQSLAQGRTVGTALCTPPVEARFYDKTESDPYRVASNLFKIGRLHTAIRAFYQIFRCPNAPLYQGLNPWVEDDNQLRPFDVAMASADAGMLLQAIGDLQLITSRLPAFAEARLLTGVFQWAYGEHSMARSTWKKTVATHYFALPESSQTVPAIQVAQDLLRWSDPKATRKNRHAQGDAHYAALGGPHLRRRPARRLQQSIHLRRGKKAS